MRLRARALEIEAVRWWPPGDRRHTRIPGVERGPREDQCWCLITHAGATRLTPGDYVVALDDGDRAVYAADYIERLYEECE